MARLVHAWVLRHDDSKLFVILYIGAAVILSIAISLFWLIAVVAVHFGLEYVRQHHLRGSPGAAIGAAAWEINLDIALVLLALVLAVYMDVVLGIAGLQAAGRLGAAASAGARGGARVAGWSRALRGILLSADDVAQTARLVYLKQQKNRAPVGITDGPGSDTVDHSWSIGDRIAVGMGITCCLLLLLAPQLTSQEFGSVASAILRELHPFP
jgi:hypothetical protein